MQNRRNWQTDSCSSVQDAQIQDAKVGNVNNITPGSFVKIRPADFGGPEKHYTDLVHSPISQPGTIHTS